MNLPGALGRSLTSHHIRYEIIYDFFLIFFFVSFVCNVGVGIRTSLNINNPGGSENGRGS